NYASDKETNIADATTNIEHTHAWLDPSCEQHSFGYGSKYVGLLNQPLVFGRRSTERIVSVIHRVARPQLVIQLLRESCVVGKGNTPAETRTHVKGSRFKA